ncbi:MAG: carbohydrate kinase family protein [Pseudomonadota bacterium]
MGSATIDVIAVAAQEIERVSLDLAASSHLLLEEGRKYPAETISNHVGGGGSNAAVAAARLGWRSAVLAVVGDDRNARAVRAHLQENGVAVEALRENPAAETGVSVMLAARRGNATVLVHRGANETLAEGDLADATFAGADLVHIAPLSGGSADRFPALVEQAAWAGAMVSVNPGIRHLRSRSDAFLGALGGVRLLSLNARELAALVPALIALELAREAPAADRAMGRDGDAHKGDAEKRERPSKPSPPAPSRGRLRGAILEEQGRRVRFEDLLGALHGAGPGFISVTDGAGGSYLSLASSKGAAEADRSEPTGPGPALLHEPAAAAPVVRGTAGAGDAYATTLACALAEGAAPETAMRRAALNAASVVGRVNTTDGLLSKQALKEALG